MADVKTYALPCKECGGDIRYLYGTQMPHEHLPKKTGQTTVNSTNPAREVELTEAERTYDYGHHTVTLVKPRTISISDSGNHRIQTEDGKLHILSPGWVAIHIDDNGKGWTF